MSKFQNVSKDLLYFWSYDNEGLKLAQLRFYEVPTVTGFQGSGVRGQGSGIRDKRWEWRLRVVSLLSSP